MDFVDSWDSVLFRIINSYLCVLRTLVALLMDVWMDGWMDEWMMYGWKDVWMAGWMDDGWMDDG